MDTNLDQQSVDHFGAQAHVWWDRDGRMKTLHDINPARLSFIERYQPLSGVTVLDIGSGGGILSQAMAEA
jgi:2-polyprenyl-6-hydroxyphenyl methylase/3-demethylubiquinone-9 3-methyltransferase